MPRRSAGLQITHQTHSGSHVQAHAIDIGERVSKSEKIMLVSFRSLAALIIGLIRNVINVLIKVYVAPKPGTNDNFSSEGTRILTPKRENDVGAADLVIASPKTPQRTMPNSAKKRRQLPNLSRSSASPGHGEKMSMIFRDASTALQGFRAPPVRPTSNTKLPRTSTPSLQVHSKKFGTVGQEHANMPIDAGSPSRICQYPDMPFDRKERSHRVSPARMSPASRQSTMLHAVDNSDELCLASPQENVHRLPDLPAHHSPSPCVGPVNVSSGLQARKEGREPVSSGFTSPSVLYSQPPKTPDEVSYQEFAQWHLPLSPSNGVPHSIPANATFQPRSSSPPMLPGSSPDAEGARVKLELWLQGLQGSIETDWAPLKQRQDNSNDHAAFDRVKSSPNEPISKTDMPKSHVATFEHKGYSQTPSTASSNKENISPSNMTLSPPVASFPSRVFNPSVEDSSLTFNELRSPHPLTPQGHLALPPKRKKARATVRPTRYPPNSGRDFTIHDDQVNDALAQLSPDVELRRKGRRPKRERCISYWDEDLLPSSSPCLHTGADKRSVSLRKGKQVLGESQQSAILTKERPFTADAEGAEFDFQA